MLGQRRRRWTNINPALGQRLVFAGYLTNLMLNEMLFGAYVKLILPIVVEGDLVLTQHSFN